MRVVETLLAVILCICASRQTDNDPNDLFWLAARSLSSALTFFELHYKEVNLDAIVGTRIVEGQFNGILKRYSENKLHVPLTYINEFRRLKTKAQYFSNKAVVHVAKRNMTYYRKMGNLIRSNFWTLWREGRDADPSLVTEALYGGEAISEETSDQCIAELFGTTSGQYGKREKCYISDRCWITMTKQGYQLYSLSHEIFYLECGLQTGCRNEMEEKMRKYNTFSLEKLIAYFCSNMLAEAVSIEQNGYVYDDLFMEQATLCGILGFRQFFRSHWLKQIVNWQDKNFGCYPIKAINVLKIGNIRRKKREEKVLENNCLCHKTTVAAGALAMYTRYILDYMIVTSYFNASHFVI